MSIENNLDQLSITADLEAEGVQSFARAWKGLMDAMEVSRQVAVGEASLA